ncbi:MAG: ATP-binding protein [Candidatus Sumerlaeaceae bacterium]
MKKRPSLQWRLFALACGLLLLLGVVSGYITYRLVRQNLTRAFDQALRMKARALLSSVRKESSGKLELEYADEMMPEFLPSPRAEYFEIRDAQGQLIEKSPSLGARELQAKKRHTHRAYAVKDVRLPDGRRGRAVRLCGVPAQEEDEKDDRATSAVEENIVCVVVARERESLDQSLAVIAASLTLGSLFVAIGGAVGLMLVVRFGLAPLRALAQRVEQLGPDDLDCQLTSPHLPQELVPIAERLDQLFARVREAIQRERRYTSDVAHELRTPLGELRATLEVAACWPDDHALLRSSIEQALESVGEAETLVNTLLELARRGHAAAPPPMQPLWFRTIIDEEIGKLAKQAEERGIRFTWLPATPTSDRTIEAHPDLFRAVMRNILSNAVEYAPEGSEVQLQTKEQEGAFLAIEVCNQAPELEAKDIEEMCQPFWRKDAARTDRQHSGLGLTITQSLCKVMGMRLSLELESDGLLVVRLVAKTADGDKGLGNPQEHFHTC